MATALLARASAFALGLTAWGVMFAGVTLLPDARGFGTHEQLGLAPCSFRTLVGCACPGCGLTTSIAQLLHGQVKSSFASHPMGPLLLVVVIMVACLAPYAAARKPRPVSYLLDLRALRRMLVVTAGVGAVTWLWRVCWVL